MRSVDRRGFLRGVALASAATAGASLVPGLGYADGSFQQEGRGAEPDWRRSPCRLCGVGCSLLVATEHGRAVAVKGDPASPVNAGLGCVKGYHSVQALYGRDRITRAMVRRGGVLVGVPLSEALDIVAGKLQETAQQYGQDSVALYGSAQWTIEDAYIASKLFKGALGTNNVETSTRLFAGSAIAGLETTYGLDGSIGCYEDIEHADVFVLWDSNLAETDPVLFSRMLDRKRSSPAVRILDLTARTTRTSYASDRTLLHQPHSSLAMANAICHEIVARQWMDRDFVDQYVTFKRGKTDIGHGLADDALVADDGAEVSWDAYVSFLEDYTPEGVQEVSGVPASALRWLASLYADRSLKVMSVWGTYVNQGVRGTWTNNALHNMHLLVGKVASPGNGPFPLTEQPSGGNAVHDAGTLTQTLPRGVVYDERDRERAAEIWGVPLANINPQPGPAGLSMFRALDRGDIRFLWIQATNPMMSLPNAQRYRAAAARPDRFIVVSEAYPTPTTDVADVVLPAAMWLERDGVFGSVERRLQRLEPIVAPPGDATTDAWQMIEVARRLGFADLFPQAQDRVVEEMWEEYGRFHSEPQTALPPASTLRSRPGVMWPYVEGRETKWRYNTTHDPATDPSRGAFDFYGHEGGRAWIWLRPYDPPAESPDEAYPFWLETGAVLEHWGGGSMTQRIPTLHRSAPHAYVEIHGDDASALGIHHGDTVRLVSRRGSLTLEARIDYRAQPARGQVFVPWFDEALPIHSLTVDAFCPLSGQPVSNTTAVRIERLRP